MYALVQFTSDVGDHLTEKGKLYTLQCTVLYITHQIQVKLLSGYAIQYSVQPVQYCNLKFPLVNVCTVYMDIIMSD